MAFHHPSDVIAYAAQHMEFWDDDPLVDPCVLAVTVPLTRLGGRHGPSRQRQVAYRSRADPATRKGI